MRPLAAAFAALALLVSAGPAAAQGWIPVWTASPAPARFDGTPEAPLAYENQTVRQDIRLPVAVRSLRLRISNEVGTEPLRIGALTLSAGGADTPLAVSGKDEVVLDPGQVLLTDTVALDLPADAVVTIQTWLPDRTRGVVRRSAVRISEGRASVPDSAQLVRRQGVVSAVLAETAGPEPFVIVALGDSITEGATSTLGADLDWPSRLAARLQAACPGRFVVLNAGISGNQILRHGRSPSALMRLDRDVLGLPSVDHVILIEGINDIRHDGNPANPGKDADQVILGYRQIVDRLHQHGVRVLGGTVTAFAGSERYDDRSAATRQALNAFIRAPGSFDGVIDFDAALADPARPEFLAEGTHRDDRLHPNDEGYRRMAEAVDLDLFDLANAGCDGG